MKKLFIFSASIILLIATSNNKLFGQDSKHDISVSYGVLTNDEFIDFYSDLFIDIFTLGYVTTDNTKELGGIFITYKNIAHKFNWGITAGYDAIISYDIKDKDTLDGKGYSNRITNFQITAVGVRLGKSLGGFMELGFGYKGLLNFGLSYQF
jgi:hypothetical protein